MGLKVVYKNARCAVLRIKDGDTCEASQVYRIYLNGEFIRETGKAVTSIYNLKPDTGYQVEARSGDSLVFKTSFTTNSEYVTLNVRDFGARGGGIQDDTLLIQTTIMAYPEKNRVLIPAGTYRIVSLFLKDNVNIGLAEGTVLSAYTDRTHFLVFQSMIQSYDEQGEYGPGTWEGNPLPMLTDIITGVNMEKAVIYGQGIIDRNAGTDEGSWQYKPRVIHTACRPRVIFLERYRQVMVQGVTVRNSPSWNIHSYFPDRLGFFNLKVLNPRDSPNTNGLDPEPCKDVGIASVCFSVGDDCIAIKSEKIYMGSTYKYPSKNIPIQRCCMRDGHRSVTIGSEMTDGVEDLTAKDRTFLHMDRGLCIGTRGDRGKDAAVDKVVFEHIRMDHVMTPFVINCFYLCDPDGHSGYMHTEEALPMDDKTPFIKSLCFRDTGAESCHVAATYMHGLPKQRIGRVEMERAHVNYAASVRKGQPAMMDGCDSHICRMGIYTNQIGELILKDVKMGEQDGPAIITENIGCVCRNI